MYIGPWQDYFLLDRRRQVTTDQLTALNAFREKVQDTVKGLGEHEAQALLSLVNPLLQDLSKHTQAPAVQVDHACATTTGGAQQPLLPSQCPNFPSVCPKPHRPSPKTPRPKLNIYSKAFSRRLLETGNQPPAAGRFKTEEHPGLHVKFPPIPTPCIAAGTAEVLRTSRSSSSDAASHSSMTKGYLNPVLASISAPASVRRTTPRGNGDYDHRLAIRIFRLSERKGLPQPNRNNEYFKQFWSWSNGSAEENKGRGRQRKKAGDAVVVSKKLEVVDRMREAYSAGPCKWSAPILTPSCSQPLKPHSPITTPGPVIHHLQLNEGHFSQVAKYFDEDIFIAKEEEGDEECEMEPDNEALSPKELTTLQLPSTCDNSPSAPRDATVAEALEEVEDVSEDKDPPPPNDYEILQWLENIDKLESETLSEGYV